MKVHEQLSKLSSAEEFFRFLDVPYDSAVLNVARLHILKRMGDNLRNAPAETDEVSARAQFRACLADAYDDFVHQSPLDARVFKVLKDAVRKRQAPLVSLTIPGKPQSL
jgi:nitrogenase-stabilizing/protective protein